MPRDNRSITLDDILPMESYELIRADKKQDAILRKQFSRISVGPHATVLFESWDSMWLQIHEMLRIEKGGEAQIADEIGAYDPMVPKGSELTATVLFELGDPVRRDAFLRTIGGIEDHISIRIGSSHVVCARPEGDVERTRESDGKASAVHFFHFDFDAAALAAWHSGTEPAMIVFDHANYGHAAIISDETRAMLTRECF